MKKTKFIALVLVIFILTLSIIPVSANYDPTIRTTAGIPGDTWTVAGVYHWVVRGETLDSIAAQYGTNVDEIRFYNSEYFNDLANRNTTTGLNIQLEHGVRLFIYHMVTVCHYVQRGDTLSDFANGYFVRGTFTLMTTTDAIVRQNQAWFNDVASLNATRGTNHELEESYTIWNVRYGHLTDGDGRSAFVNDPTVEYAGIPLYISVPVQIRQDVLAPSYLRETYTYQRNNNEKVGSAGISQQEQIPFPNTLFTNNLLPAATGWTRAIGFPSQNLRLGNYRIPGFYGGVWY